MAWLRPPEASCRGGRSALLTSLILGVVWAFWRLPLMVIGQIHVSTRCLSLLDGRVHVGIQ